MVKVNSRKSSKFWFFLAVTIVIFALLQLINPIEADAPSDDEGRVAKSTTSSRESSLVSKSFQDLSDNIAEVAVLMYHHIGPLPDENDKVRYSLTVSEEEFESHLQFLKKGGFNLMTLGQVESAIKNNKLPEKTIVLTFDDGYDDNYLYAKPILEKYGFPATFFIISNKIGQAEYMDEDQVKELSKNHEIGSHSYSHPSMVKLSDYYLERELKQSKEDLQELIGRDVKSFCYPAGKYDDKAVEKLKEYGYAIAVTTEASTGSFGIDSLLLVPRFRVSPAISLETLVR
jgi:peptidoglycan/xylan/chitin deacetylase (PgdA/CDA1 family)